MAQSNAEQEPTMEEILASIRRIINEDDEPQAEAAPAAPQPAAEPEPQAEPAFEAAPEPEPEPEPQAEESVFDDDVLELTDRVEEETEGTSPMAIADDLMIVDREEELASAPEPEPEPEPEPVMAEAPKPSPAEDDESLLAEPAASAAAGAFAALTENLRVSSDNGQTLEGIVRELMRPMLKQWLDENLPSIVEAKVQEEIERVARRRR
ncbi:MAG: DUF2497 domain-containing protein [Glycocaulis sp.]|uniref:DUF2497 domain-containing protein n=1 Tax=Glycocaulis sp. TaxID=1969725 RepID=UPI003F709373